MIQLDSYPFSKLRLPSDEEPIWKAHNPTFHRGTSYGIVLTKLALYLYSPFLLSFARWRRIPLSEIEDIQFKDSRIIPSLRVRLNHRTEVLRTPLDYAVEMDYDREKLAETVVQVSSQLVSFLNTDHRNAMCSKRS